MAVEPVRVGLGPTRGVVMVEGRVELFPAGAVPDRIGDGFAAAHWDARLETKPYAFYGSCPSGSRSGARRTRSRAGA